MVKASCMCIRNINAFFELSTNLKKIGNYTVGYSSRDERWSRHNQILESKYVDILYVQYSKFL